ncbi:MAG: phage portal protein [Bacteroides sp.]|nr:phage portal protein [Bacteroides sp.]
MKITYISVFLKKDPWRRLVNPDALYVASNIADRDYYNIPSKTFGGLTYKYLGNAELYNESCEGAHIINSNTYSTRPINEIVEREIEVLEDGVVVKKTIQEEVTVGYDPVETVRSGLPEMILTQKASHIGKNGIEIADESGNDNEAYSIIRSYKDSSGIDNGWMEAIYAAGKVGDSAIYIYRTGEEIEYSVFSYLDGSMLFPHKDDKGRDMLVRLYHLHGREAVDIITTKEKSTWVKGSSNLATSAGEEFLDWLIKLSGWFPNPPMRESKDGWICINETESQLDEETPQFVYLRFDDSFIGHAMDNINALDRALSYTSDKMRSTAYGKFLIKAFKIANLPPLSSGEEVIGMEGDADQLKASDAHYVTPPNLSDIATFNIGNIFDAIMQSTMSIDLQPEILKSGADSSQTLKLLLRREIQWCHVTWPKLSRPARRVVKIIQAHVDCIEKGAGRFSQQRLSVWNTPWLPQDEDAAADRVSKLYYASIISGKSSRSELNLQYPNDEIQIQREQEEKIYRETYIKFKAQAQARKDFGLDQTASEVIDISEPKDENPVKPGVDNRAPNK